MKLVYIIFLPIILFSQNSSLKNIELGKRGPEYRIWIYFKDKIDSDYINPSSKAIARRKKNDINSNKIWQDLQVSPNYKREITLLGLEIENESRWLNAVSVLCKKSDIKRILKCTSSDRANKSPRIT